MGFSQGTIKLESTLREGFGFRICLAGGSTGIIFEQRVTVSESNISEGVIRVLVGCLLELLKGFLEVLHSALVPVITPFQIELISFRITGITPGQLLLFFAAQF